MSRYNNMSHTSEQQDESFNNRETIESYLARGGQIQTLKKTASVKRKVKLTVGAQELYNKAVGTKDEAAVVQFLKSQGFEIT